MSSPSVSALHDIGKIGIDEKILNKPGKLTPEEFEIMKSHTLIGAAMLNDLNTYKDEMLMKVSYQICRWHHERYDGRGYPDGLKGEEIPDFCPGGGAGRCVRCSGEQAGIQACAFP